MELMKATFRTDSVLTGLPSAQTLFGAFCSILKETKGQEELDAYLQSFASDPWFVHSDMFLQGLFPPARQAIFPLDLIQSSMGHKKPEEKLAALADFKKYKKLRFLSEGVLNRYFLCDRMEELKRDILQGKNVELSDQGILQLKDEKTGFCLISDLQTKNASKMGTQEKELYYMEQFYPGREQRFTVYFKSNISREKLADLLRFLGVFGIGPKRSVGYNFFTLESLEILSASSKGKMKYLLSSCIPDGSIDYENSSYQIQSSLYRGSKAYNGGHYVGRFSAFTPGSMLAVREEKDYYGKLERSISMGKEIYHYGIGMVM